MLAKYKRKSANELKALGLEDLGYVDITEETKDDWVEPYMSDGWNILDGTTVLLAWVPWMLASFLTVNLSILKVVRTVRVLRPLKFISKAEGLKVTLMCFFGTLIDIINVFLVLMMVLLLFSIFAVSMLKGKLFYCDSLDEGQ